ncbi:GtrA family protein [Stenotrophomonas sp. CW117]|uniref:GtrA family protein n=1 Tax=Stenotrophomonas TaxID=40323 RepID=UPI00070339E5|nr:MULTISPECIES: GtrA family protein [Stenotrophomonas]KRG86337.1 hypothetical protein ABB33_04010 [Stenotrophomonas acidaminiphila]QOF97840.1 GtrA family protein [Stenotrophomonas sp. CW117]
MKKFWGRIADHDLVRYLIASLVALAMDMAVLSCGLRLFHLALGWAATSGFVAGAITAYLLSIRWVFRQRVLERAPMVEFLSFVGIGVAGLGVTQMVLWLGATKLGLLPEMVKLAAAGATFAFNYLARRSLLFMARSRIIAGGENLV